MYCMHSVVAQDVG